jgi:cysteinyl-tRNA synthetase
MESTRTCWGLKAPLVVTASLVAFVSCVSPAATDFTSVDYRQEMRDLVIEISDRARLVDSAFIVIPQNGNELITLDGEPAGPLAEAYLDAIDGVGREDLFYGYEDDDEATPEADRDFMLGFLDRAEAYGVEVLVTDYCTTPAHVDDSYARNVERGYVSFAAERDLASIPSYPGSPWAAHSGEVVRLSDARNFLYLLDPWGFDSRTAYLEALAGSDHDLLIIDAYTPNANGEGATLLSVDDVDSLREKPRGGARLVVAYLSIGEAEDYRPYWDDAWDRDPPEWLGRENRDWPGNYIVRYWMTPWQEIVFRQLDEIIAAGFDGVYLDIIDAFEYYE